jgi:hypothetical protein
MGIELKEFAREPAGSTMPPCLLTGRDWIGIAWFIMEGWVTGVPVSRVVMRLW